MIDIWAQWQLDRPTVKAGRESVLVPAACQIVRAAQTGTDTDGHPTYGPPTVVATVDCEFVPAGTPVNPTGLEQVGPNRTYISTEARFYVPEGADVRPATDEIRYGGRVYPVKGVPPMGPYDVVQPVSVEEVS